MVFWQWFLGMGLGIIAIALTTNLAIGYSEERRRRDKNVYFVQEPETRCPICLENMKAADMKYLRCLHAIHDKCFEQLRLRQIRTCPTCRETVV